MQAFCWLQDECINLELFLIKIPYLKFLENVVSLFDVRGPLSDSGVFEVVVITIVDLKVG